MVISQLAHSYYVNELSCYYSDYYAKTLLLT